MKHKSLFKVDQEIEKDIDNDDGGRSKKTKFDLQ